MERFGSRSTEGILGFSRRNVLVPLLVLSGAVNLGLAHRLNDLATRPMSPLAPGTRVPPISGESVSGLVTITYPASQPLVLYYFSADCGWCRRNWGNIGVLANSLKGRFRLVALSTLPRVAEDLRNRLSGFDMVWNFSQDVRSAYRLRGTPMTIVVGTDGKVLKAWSGAFQGQVEQEIERFFNVELPGLTR
jgi:hypothetical protein